MTDQPTANEPDTSSGERPFSEQLAERMGGVRGLIESGIPVAVFVLVNLIWGLNPGLIASVGVALGIVAYRAWRRQPIRHAVNGLFGVGIGAVIAWRTGDAKNYYVPGILTSLGYGVLLIGSVAFKRPVVGYMWSVIAAGGKQTWRQRPRLLRTFQWVTMLWAVLFLAKAAVQGALYYADEATWLGIARLAMGYPPYLLMLGVTVWAVRRATHAEPVSEPAQATS